MQNSEPMHLAKQLYEALSSLNENDDSFRFDSIRKNFELRLEILQPWLNEAAYGKELYREILFPGKASIEIANLYAHAAVYWRTESQDYNEAQKIVQPVTFGGITCLLKFSLPASSLPITNLRFNPVDRPAFCSISRISLENTLSEEIWSADLNGDMFSSCSDDMIILGKEVRQQAFHQIVAIRKNPYGTLIIPTEVIQTLTEGCTLYIEMRLEMLAQAVQPLAERLLRLRESKQCIENVNIHAESDSDRVRLNHAKSQLLGETEKFASPEENNIFIYGMISGIDDSALLQTNRLFDLTGFNTGNLVTSYSIMQILGGKIRSTNWNYPLTEITDKRTTAILVLANHLGDHIDMGDQAIIFSDLQINLVGIGLGAQAGTIQSDINLSLGTLNWIRAIEEHSPTEAPNIALRGEFSRRILEKYKLEKKTAVLGCASLFISPDKNLGITIEKRFWGTNSKRVAVTAGHQEWTHLSKIESSLAKIVSETKGSYICQSPLEMVQLGRAECHLLSEEARFNCRSYINPEMTNEEFIEWSNLHASSFFSASAWLEYIRRFDFVIGTRIQGVILGLQAGIPSLCIAHDSRTEELCQTMMVPYVKANTILDGITFNDIPRLFTFDGSMFDKNRATLAKGYVDFLSSNNINSANYMREFTASQSVLSNVS